jgi:hypothetical protein
VNKNKYIKIYYSYTRIWICTFDSKVELIKRFKFKFENQMKRKIKSKRKENIKEKKKETNRAHYTNSAQLLRFWPTQGNATRGPIFFPPHVQPTVMRGPPVSLTHPSQAWNTSRWRTWPACLWLWLAQAMLSLSTGPHRSARSFHRPRRVLNHPREAAAIGGPFCQLTMV